MGRQNARFFSPTTEYLLVYAKDARIAEFNRVVLDDEKLKEFDLYDDKSRYKLKKFLHNHKKGSRSNKQNNWYPIYVSTDLKEISLERKDGYHELYPINDKGIERSWMTIKDTTKDNIDNKEVVVKKDKDGKIELFYKFREQQRFPTHWIDKKYNANHHGMRLLEKYTEKRFFSYPKSMYAVMDVIKIMTKQNDIILDFFAGSGTSGHSILELNNQFSSKRQFILIEQIENHVSIQIERLSKVIQESKGFKQNERHEKFTYIELKKNNEFFIQLIGESTNTEELLDLWGKMKEKSFLNYNVDIKKQEEHIEEFKQLSLEQQKQHLLELLDKNQLYVNLSSLKDEDFACTDEEKKLTGDFYQLNIDK